jgi:hypothetical protein
MNFMVKKMFFLSLIMLSMRSVKAYELFFSNFTSTFLVIAIKQRSSMVEKYYQVVPPGGSVIQASSDANCLESLQWAELNPKLPLRGGLDLVDKEHGYQIPHDKQKLFDETFYNKTTGRGLYLWNNLAIKSVPNELFQNTVASAKELGGAVSSTLADMISAYGKIAGIDICKHRQFSIIDTGKQDKLTRQPQFIALIGEGE